MVFVKYNLKEMIYPSSRYVSGNSKLDEVCLNAQRYMDAASQAEDMGMPEELYRRQIESVVTQFIEGDFLDEAHNITELMRDNFNSNPRACMSPYGITRNEFYQSFLDKIENIWEEQTAEERRKVYQAEVERINKMTPEEKAKEVELAALKREMKQFWQERVMKMPYVPDADSFWSTTRASDEGRYLKPIGSEKKTYSEVIKQKELIKKYNEFTCVTGVINDGSRPFVFRQMGRFSEGIRGDPFNLEELAQKYFIRMDNKNERFFEIVKDNDSLTSIITEKETKPILLFDMDRTIEDNEFEMWLRNDKSKRAQ